MYPLIYLPNTDGTRDHAWAVTDRRQSDRGHQKADYQVPEALACRHGGHYREMSGLHTQPEHTGYDLLQCSLEFVE